MSTGAIDRLGDRLRISGELSTDDLAQLQALRREFDNVLADARHSVAAAFSGISPTTRLKTVQTLISKLKREPTMNLSQVQDVAGMRIVRDMSLSQQDELASKLVEHFEGGKVVDRRTKPSFGYRALHVVVKPNGRLVEIQLRTPLQDRWAQILERLADSWGRQIRYGLDPDQPHDSAGDMNRAEIVDVARRLGPLIAECEDSALRRGIRVQLSSDRFCGMVVVLLNELAQLRIG
jgi:ppGpp synthetase/RelA/SpoT-type nucleotidyltranferase